LGQFHPVVMVRVESSAQRNWAPLAIDDDPSQEVMDAVATTLETRRDASDGRRPWCKKFGSAHARCLMIIASTGYRFDNDKRKDASEFAATCSVQNRRLRIFWSARARLHIHLQWVSRAGKGLGC
jgi:hypothetical protein